MAVSEGAVPRDRAEALAAAQAELVAAKKARKAGKGADKEIKTARARIDEIHGHLGSDTLALSEELESRTNLESRVTILGHLQRGGTPSAADRLLGGSGAASRREDSALQRLEDEHVVETLIADGADAGGT